MTIDAQSGLTITTMAYDLDDRLTAIDAGGTANDASFTHDALGRFRTRVIAAGTETYSYLEGSETVARIAGPGGTNTDSIVSPAGDRLGVRVGATVNWFRADLHGSVAGSLDSGETTVVNAVRYDAWGQIIGSPGSAGGTRVGDKAWKYQGRLDVSPDGLATPLYDMSARFYMPGTGTFSQLDTYAGSAQDPLSMNRFLYAQANPASLIDPTGHYAEEGDGSSYKAGPIVRTKTGQIYRKAYRAPSRRHRFDRAHRNTGGYAAARRWRSLHSADRREAARSVPVGRSARTQSVHPIAGFAHGATEVTRGIGTAALEFGTGVVSGAVGIASCMVPGQVFGCAPGDFLESAVTDPAGTASSVANAAAVGIGQLSSDLQSGDPYRVSHAVSSVFLTVGTAGAPKAVSIATC